MNFLSVANDLELDFKFKMPRRFFTKGNQKLFKEKTVRISSDLQNKTMGGTGSWVGRKVVCVCCVCVVCMAMLCVREVYVCVVCGLNLLITVLS